jgi:hypothetical protein
MSKQEIIDQLPKLTQPELAQVDACLRELLHRGGSATKPNWGAALLEIAGTAQGLPDDFACNHDHYLHGAPRR